MSGWLVVVTSSSCVSYLPFGKFETFSPKSYMFVLIDPPLVIMRQPVNSCTKRMNVINRLYYIGIMEKNLYCFFLFKDNILKVPYMSHTDVCIYDIKHL